MAKYWFPHTLIVLFLVMTVASVVGHFAADAACLLQDFAGDAKCVQDGRAVGANILNAAPSVTNELHLGLDLPAAMTISQLAALAFALFTVRLAVPAYYFSPAPPPPKRLS